jgi:tetratricopeptide (TPR) repeat protein
MEAYVGWGGMVFVADDLGAWLVGLLADAGRRRLVTWVLGTDQERALRQAATAAVQRTAAELRPDDDRQAGHLAIVVSEVFTAPAEASLLDKSATLLEGLQAEVAGQLAPLDDADLTGTGRSSADLLEVPAGLLAEKLAGHLVREIVIRGARGGPLEPLAAQLNFDAAHLQGQRLEQMFGQLAKEIQDVLARGTRSPDDGPTGMAVRLAARPVFLVGREDLLTELDARLTSRDQTGPSIVVLYGLGGAGKTSVAVEYAHRHLEECAVVWQLAAEKPAALAAGFSELAAQLGVRDGPGAGDPVAQVHAALARRSDWLLVFDNVRGPAAINGLLPPAGGGRVLITSQYPNWPGGQGLEVPVLDQAKAAEFLLSRTGASAKEEEAAGELARELGGLPLALEQAAAYMQATGRSIPDYLGLFRERWAELLDRGDPAGYDKRVATTWALAFADLGQGGPAAGLLRLAACCAAEDIPLSLLLRLGPGLAEAFAAEVASLLVPLLDDLVRDEAVAGLRRYSLISAPHDGLVSVHRLVQAITLAQLPPDVAADWQQATGAVIEAALPEDPDDPAHWQSFAALLPHAQTALTPASYGRDKIATYLRAIGNYGAAVDLQQRILKACEASLGDESPRTLTARARLATLTGEAGDPVAARDQCAELMPVMTRVLGAEHPDTLAARASLAYWAGEAGHPAAARDQYAALLPVLERVLGDEHLDTLTTRGNLARLTGDTGDAAAARDQFADLLPILERVSGAEQPDTLIIRASLAYWTGMAGNPAAARDQYAELLPIRQRVLGAEHPRTLTAHANLARWTGEAGDPAAARDQLAALLPVLERVLGDEHRDTLTACGNLASWTRQAENPG